MRASNSEIEAYTNFYLMQSLEVFTRNSKSDIDIIKNITDEAQGIYMLAKLQVESITSSARVGGKFTFERYERYGDRGYDKFYGGIMSRLVSQDDRLKSCGLTSLCWLVNAKRPLTITELCEAVKTQMGGYKYDLARQTLRRHDERQFPRISEIITSCCGLIIVDDRTVRFCHHTAAEYVLRNQNDWFQSPHQGSLARILLLYLSMSTFRTGTCHSPYDLERRLSTYPLYSYAACYWGYHLRDSTDESNIDKVLAFLRDEGLVSAAYQALLAKRPLRDDFKELRITGMHLAAYLGLRRPLESLNQSRWDVNVRDAEGRTPLFWAARLGRRKVAKDLLQLGADVDATDDSFITPLMAAVRAGHATTTELLLQYSLARPWTKSEKLRLIESLRPPSARGVVVSVEISNILQRAQEFIEGNINSARYRPSPRSDSDDGDYDSLDVPKSDSEADSVEDFLEIDTAVEPAANTLADDEQLFTFDEEEW
ncbi:hypothetical protein ABW21_db0203468 [Orbilia brochopaga]|nr:hypothetical protein ABW21_db0203468 [Drechslerella brochopaga]